MRLYFVIFAACGAVAMTHLYVSASLLAADGSDAGDPPPRAAIVIGERSDSGASQPTLGPDRLPDPSLLRPLELPPPLPMDRSDRLREGAEIRQRRMHLERMGDPRDPQVQDRLRRLDRAADRLR